MIRLERTTAQPIGLDLGADSVKLLQLEAGADSLGVLAAARKALCDEHGQTPSDPAELRKTALAAARRLLDTGGFKGKRVVAALPREIVHFKNLRLPMIPAEELPAAIDFEAASIFPFDTAQAHVHFIHAGDVRQAGDTRQEVIVLAARNQDVDTFVEDLSGCGCEIESIDFEPAAIYRCIERFIRRREDEQGVFVLLDIGLRRSQLIMGRGRDISFYKPIDIGGRHLNEAVARKLSLSLDEARALRRRLADGQSQLARGEDEEAETDSSDERRADQRTELQRDPVRQAVADATRSIIEDLGRAVTLCLRYHSVAFRGHRPARLGIVGGESSDPYVCDVLSTTLGLPIQPESPLRHVDISRMPPGERRGPLSGWAAALGLGLRLVSSQRGTTGASAAGVAGGATRANPLLAGSADVVELPEPTPSSPELKTTTKSEPSAPATMTGRTAADKAQQDRGNQRERACA